MLSGIGFEGDPGQRQPRRDGVRSPVLVSGERAELRPMTGQQRQGEDGHGHQHDNRHRDRCRAAAEQAGAGPPGGGHPVVKHEGVVRPSPAGLARPGRGHQAGRTFPDGWPVIAPPVVPFRAVVLVDPGVRKDGRAQRDPHGSGPPCRGRLGGLRPGVLGGGVPAAGSAGEMGVPGAGTAIAAGPDVGIAIAAGPGAPTGYRPRSIAGGTAATGKVPPCSGWRRPGWPRPGWPRPGGARRRRPGWLAERTRWAGIRGHLPGRAEPGSRASARGVGFGVSGEDQDPSGSRRGEGTALAARQGLA